MMKEGSKMAVIEYVITIVLAFMISFCATPIAKKIAFKLNAIDVPKDERRMHKKPIALMGGLAIIAGFCVAIIYNIASPSEIFVPDRELAGLFVGILIILVSGIIDDIYHVKARVKLLFQVAAAISAVVISDSRILRITNPFSETGMTELNMYISYAVTILWIVSITNAVNLIDGLDGLAAGVSSICSLSLFFVSVLGLSPESDAYTAIITGALAGATLGFLPFNFNPAKIFMGETGSAFLGFALSVISIQGTLKSYTAISIAIPILVLGIPLFDTAFAILRRILNGKSPMEADRGHLHHRLIDIGLSHKQSVIVMYIASASLGLCAVVLANKGVLSAIILLVSVSIFIVTGAKFMNEVSSADAPDENENKDAEAVEQLAASAAHEESDEQKNTSEEGIVIDAKN
mgnify:CR=1 FL=1